ncbi:hypothetical protein Q9966_001704 [Columba livia]|nr:hypothetical protein Q9966_001704 [Columba livia]
MPWQPARDGAHANPSLDRGWLWEHQGPAMGASCWASHCCSQLLLFQCSSGLFCVCPTAHHPRASPTASSFTPSASQYAHIHPDLFASQRREVFNQKKIWLIPEAQGLSLCSANRILCSASRILRSPREGIAQRPANRLELCETTTSLRSDNQRWLRRPKRTWHRLANHGLWGLQQRSSTQTSAEVQDAPKEVPAHLRRWLEERRDLDHHQDKFMDILKREAQENNSENISFSISSLAKRIEKARKTLKITSHLALAAMGC